MKHIGPHVSIAGGVENAPLNAQKVGATGFGMFTKNQRQWSAKPYTSENIQKFKSNMAECGYSPESVIPHDGYLINLGHPDPEKREKSLNAFIDEIERVEQLSLLYLNFHPGSHLREISPEECMSNIADSINTAHTSTSNAVLLLENTAGQGSNLGSKFEELAYIIERVDEQERVGVCLDTCHLLAAGYDVRSKDSMERVWEEFDRVIGFSKLKGFHLNDAKFDLDSHLDRHHSLGMGTLGWEPFRWIVEDPRFDGCPMILETIDPELWPAEIERLSSMSS